MRTKVEAGAELQLFELTDVKHRFPKCFTVIECIGEGATCVAYRATDNNAVPVKLKQFYPRHTLPGTENYIELENRFKDAVNQQISLLGSADTANITTGLLGIFSDSEGRLWTAATDIFGKTVDKLIRENSLITNLRIIRRIAESSKAFHEAGWLLLDMKPENILAIDSLGISGVNFFDFDSFVRVDEIASAIKEKKPLLLSSSENYSAPELLSGTVDLSRISARSDYYSIGAIMFEAVFGRPPRHIDCLPGKTYDFRKTEVPADAARKITTFLRRSITASIDERFDSDDELIASLDTVIRYTDSTKPHLSLSIPKPVSGFTGREKEENEIISRLSSGALPLFICGEGGIGKTQLILKVAADCSKDFDFYYAAYKGNIRETILSVPLDNYNLESAGDSAYEGVMQCFRNDCAPNSVLIIDSLEGSDPDALLKDEEYEDLIGLPLKIVFTTRNFFENAECLKIDRLPDDCLQQIVKEYLPEQPEAAGEIIDALSGHTLAVKIAARSVNAGLISVQNLLKAINHEESIGEKLCSIFKACGFDKEEKRMLLAAALFPSQGISSDVLYSLLTKGEFAAANRLEKAGWLDFDSYGNMWTVHDLVRNAIRSRRDTRPTADRVRPLKMKLAAAENGHVPFAKRYQLNEIYGNIGRLPAGRRNTYITAAAVLAAAASCLFSLFGAKAEKPLNPELTLDLYFDETVSSEELQHDKETVKRRLKALAGPSLKIVDSGNTCKAVFPLSSFGNYSTLDDAVRLFINRPMTLYAIAYVNDSHFEYSFESVERNDILSVSTEYGSVPGYSLFDYGLDLGEKYYYLKIVFSDRTAESIYGYLAENRDVTLKFDIEENYSDHITLDLLLPAEGKNTFYIIDSRLSGKRQAECLKFSLEANELAGQTRFNCSANPGELWESPEAYSAGKNQRGIEDLPEEYVVLGYMPYSPQEVSDSEFAADERTFKDMLDSLGTDYAFGFSTSDSRELMCAIGTEAMSQELAECLAYYSSSFSIRGGNNILFNPGYYETSASVEQNAFSGGYELVLQFEDKGNDYDAAHRLKEASEKMLEQGLSEIYLGIGNYEYFLRAEVGRVIEDGRLCFASMPMFNAEVIGEEYLPILNFFAHDLTSETHLGYSLKSERFSSDSGKYGIESSFAGDEEMLELLAERFPDVTVIREINTNYIRFYLNYEFEDDLVTKTADEIAAIWNEADLADRFIDRALFYPLASPEIGEYLWIDITRHWFDSGELHCSYACHGGRLDDFSDEVKNVFSSERFLNAIGGGPIA